MSDSGARGASRAAALVPIAIAALALFLRLYAPGPVTETVDERVWMIRSSVFATAVSHHDYRHASTFGAVRDISEPTMPGVTTMWAGALGRDLVGWGHEWGLNADPKRPIDGSAQVLRASRAIVALGCSLSLAVLIWLAARLVGRRAAWTAGVLLAVEPWLVGNSDLLHTDAMVTMFGAVSMLALAVSLVRYEEAPLGGAGSKRHGRHVRRSELDIDVFVLVVSAFFGSLALLTKLNAFALLGPGLAIIVIADASTRVRSGTDRPARLAGRAVSLGIIWTLLAAVIFVAVYPAMWVSPVAEISHMRTSLKQLAGSHSQFFRGHAVDDPGLAFYPVVLWFRLSPWFLLGSIATAVAIVTRAVARLARSARLVAKLPKVPGWILLVTVPYLIALGSTEKKLDRYILPTFPFAALAVGITFAALVEWLSARWRSGWWRPAAAVAITGLLGLATAAEAPYAIAYVDPVVGGQRVAKSQLLLGWGEGTSALGAVIAKREAGHCNRVRIADVWQLRVSLQCGRVVGTVVTNLGQTDYAILHIGLQQRGTLADYSAAVRHVGTLVAQTKIHGVVYEQLWYIPHPPPRP